MGSCASSSQYIEPVVVSSQITGSNEYRAVVYCNRIVLRTYPADVCGEIILDATQNCPGEDPAI